MPVELSVAAFIKRIALCSTFSRYQNVPWQMTYTMKATHISGVDLIMKSAYRNRRRYRVARPWRENPRVEDIASPMFGARAFFSPESSARAVAATLTHMVTLGTITR